MSDANGAQARSRRQTYFEYQLRIVRAKIRLARGAGEEIVFEDLNRALELGRAVKDPQALMQVLSHMTRVSVQLGRMEEARLCGAELLDVVTSLSLRSAIVSAGEFAWVAGALDAEVVFRRVLVEANLPIVWRDGYQALLDRDFTRAAEMFGAVGFIDEGDARLEAGRKLLTEGRREEAMAQLQKAIVFYGRLGATRYIREAEELLSGAGLEIPA